MYEFIITCFYQKKSHVKDRKTNKIDYFCIINELPRKHIKAEYSNKNGWQIVTSK